jgi:Rad3-related DNA helicase
MYNPATDDNPDLLPQIVWRRDPNTDPMEFFPFREVRPQQETAIRQAIEAYKTKKIIVLEGPCGSGKSAIIMTLANYFGTAHILTPLKALQTQYLQDFPNVADSRGKGNYICTWDLEHRIAKQQTMDLSVKLYPKNCANAPCTKKGFSRPDSCTAEMSVGDGIVSFDGNRTVHSLTGAVLQFKGCPYQVAKLIAGQTPIICHNFDSFLYQNMNPKGGFTQRPFLAVDECHNFEGKIINFNGVTIPEELMMPGDNLIDIKDMTEFFDYFCKQRPYSFADMMKYCDNERELFIKKEENSGISFSRSRFFFAAYNYWNIRDDSKKANEYNDLAEKVARIGLYYQNATSSGRRCEYEFELQNRRNNAVVLTGNPLYAGMFSNSILQAGEHILLASATILNHKIFCRSIGINPDETEFIQIESDFPKEKRIIKKRYAGSMSYTKKQETMPRMIQMIDEILANHDQQKGLIHSHSFEFTKAIFDNLSSKYSNRLLTMEMFKAKSLYNAKEAMLDFHAQTKDPTVIIDPACDQGVDLPDDLCRFQCLVKVPYPSLNKWMKARMAQPGGQDW